MTPETVFAKSPKGIEEIETRAHKLGSRLRQVLIRIDGIKTLDELVGEAGDMGEQLVGQIEELERQGFLTDTTEAEETIAPVGPLASQASGAAGAPQAATTPQATGQAIAPAPARSASSKSVPVASHASAKTALAAVKPAAAPPAAKPASTPAPEPEAIEFNSPVKFRLQDLLVEAMGIETGSAGQALNRCRNRDDLARWVDLAVAPIEQASGKSKAKAFYKQAKKLVGG